MCVVLVAGEEMRYGRYPIEICPPRHFSHCYWLLPLIIKLECLVNRVCTLRIKLDFVKGHWEQSI